MKSSAVFIAVVLFAGLCSQISGQNTNKPSKCCFSYLEKRIPLKMLSNFERTRSDCTRPGIVFITRKGHLVCADPKQKWVKDSVDHLNAIFNTYPEELNTDVPSVGKK
ncbi:C-C motif chemokine 3-like isoform X2 [Erpetoichthys calabaricus]|uniref:C-C motif chemokine 3-like isoform X1 n=1 Tax=Erpetoichthys calabaricus TaxID=27687 RepID=UPI00109FCF0D|nr:C-C motif chemokine 3-like isoform X1 [Erpetoichthys calabaricus]XP_051780245.1 C-C motif chemokine 3-like isoform X2 [Erpetoichthys calabaricus]